MKKGFKTINDYIEYKKSLGPEFEEELRKKYRLRKNKTRSMEKPFDPWDQHLNVEELKFDEPTDAEKDRIYTLQKDYVTNMNKYGVKMSPEHQRMFKIIVNKNYTQNPLKDEKPVKTVAEKEFTKLLKR